MAGSLKYRQPGLTEWMDKPYCDPVLLHNTYRYFPAVNRLISRWRAVYRQFIRPELTYGKRFRLLDVGSGGGDITRNIWHWAGKDGYRLDVTGVDPDPRALAYARLFEKPGPTDSNEGVLQFIQADTSSLIRDGESFDFVTCNHVLHHLPDDALHPFLHDLEQLATRRIICSDIQRSRIGYTLFSILTSPVFRDSFIRTDGLISIRKSFTRKELSDTIPSNWTVHAQLPFRLLAMYDVPAARNNIPPITDERTKPSTEAKSAGISPQTTTGTTGTTGTTDGITHKTVMQ